MSDADRLRIHLKAEIENSGPFRTTILSEGLARLNRDMEPDKVCDFIAEVEKAWRKRR